MVVGDDHVEVVFVGPPHRGDGGGTAIDGNYETGLELCGTALEGRYGQAIPVMGPVGQEGCGHRTQLAEEAHHQRRAGYPIHIVITKDQDRFPAIHRFPQPIHRLAHAGSEDGRLTAEIAPIFPPGGGRPITRDNGIRPDSSLEQMAKLRPAFDRQYGSVTAGNASPLTDGAGAVLLMSESAARALGYQPLAFIRSYAVAALDPGDQLLMGPAYAVPKAIDRAGIRWSDLELVEMHEAFAAQVLSNIRAFESQKWAERLGRSAPIGEVNWNTLNVMGGSISIGHPFGATGARITLTLANEMVRRDAQLALISVCAQGGMGFAMVLERA